MENYEERGYEDYHIQYLRFGPDNHPQTMTLQRDVGFEKNPEITKPIDVPDFLKKLEALEALQSPIAGATSAAAYGNGLIKNIRSPETDLERRIREMSRIRDEINRDVELRRRIQEPQ